MKQQIEELILKAAAHRAAGMPPAAKKLLAQR
jgi:hypothetical protein